MNIVFVRKGIGVKTQFIVVLMILRSTNVMYRYCFLDFCTLQFIHSIYLKYEVQI